MTHDDTFFCNGHSNLPDLENDKIKITCDDDLKFFMEESPCHKVIFDFAPDSDQELSRKRNLSQNDEESWEVSKKIRKQLSQIDLSSDSSMMETDSDDELIASSIDSSKNSSVLNVAQQPSLIPSTSKQAREELLASQNTQKVNIISVEVVKQPVEIHACDTVIIDSPDSVIFESETIVIPDTDENGNDAQVVPGNQVIAQEETSLPEPAVEQENVQKKPFETQTKRVVTNRIVISDSEEDAEDSTNGNEQWRGRRTGAYSSSYSFSGANGNMYGASCGFGTRGESPPRHHRRGHHGRHGHGRHEHGRHSFQEGRNCQDWRFRHAENMARAQEQARVARENVRRASESAANAVRASTAFIPDMMANFRAHFQRPMFSVADINQQIFGRR